MFAHTRVRFGHLRARVVYTTSCGLPLFNVLCKIFETAVVTHNCKIPSGSITLKYTNVLLLLSPRGGDMETCNAMSFGHNKCCTHVNQPQQRLKLVGEFRHF